MGKGRSGNRANRPVSAQRTLTGWLTKVIQSGRTFCYYTKCIDDMTARLAHL